MSDDEYRCACQACWPRYPYFRVCSVCGNKRCPHATDHRLVCTGSNESGQPGSSYGPPLARSFVPTEDMVEAARASLVSSDWQKDRAASYPDPVRVALEAAFKASEPHP